MGIAACVCLNAHCLNSKHHRALHELLHGLGFISGYGTYLQGEDGLTLPILTPMFNIDNSTGTPYIQGMYPALIFDRYMVETAGSKTFTSALDVINQSVLSAYNAIASPSGISTPMPALKARAIKSVSTTAYETVVTTVPNATIVPSATHTPSSTPSPSSSPTSNSVQFQSQVPYFAWINAFKQTAGYASATDLYQQSTTENAVSFLSDVGNLTLHTSYVPFRVGSSLSVCFMVSRCT